jgi:hypothetical protein
VSDTSHAHTHTHINAQTQTHTDTRSAESTGGTLLGNSKRIQFKAQQKKKKTVRPADDRGRAEIRRKRKRIGRGGEGRRERLNNEEVK